ncbi:MAG TPA: hypothetical protein DCW55_03290 [Candidatus Pacebacteria bacterium]|nr:MAG: hypothetical protein A2378_02020 [Candidatus Pacebacteria bacterium RIFOXYB1_FULL_44_10]HAU99230.1 hypothetical protein [Candidatus Paceibacterota bacterium]HAX01761.1 hypothetical protein [Candidatus Paceibacterota bacterium]
MEVIFMITLQVISVVFGLFMLYWIRVHFRRKHFSIYEYSGWMTIWLLFVYLAIFPQTVQGIIETMHISRVFDLLVIIALMIIVFLSMQNRIAIRRLEKKIEVLVRDRAIQHTKKEHEK